MMKPVQALPAYFLIGFSGSGKTTVGRHLAELSGRHFVDLDEKLAEIGGKPVMLLYGELGEKGYRQLEVEILRDLLKRPEQVIALGAGTYVAPICREVVQKVGVVIHLDATVETLFERIRSSEKRLLFQTVQDTEIIPEEVLIQRIHYLYNLRRPVYLTADITVSVEGKQPQEIAREIVQILRS